MTIIEQTDGHEAAAVRIQPQGETRFAVLGRLSGLGVARRVALAATIVVAQPLLTLPWLRRLDDLSAMAVGYVVLAKMCRSSVITME